MFLSPTRLHKSNVCENIYFLSQKTHTNRKLPDLFVLIYLFSTKKSTVGVFFFICKLYLKNSIKLIIFFFFAAARVQISFVTSISRNKSILFSAYMYFFLSFKDVEKVRRSIIFQLWK